MIVTIKIEKSIMINFLEILLILYTLMIKKGKKLNKIDMEIS